MAGNWGNVQQGLVSGYSIGRSTGGGRLGALGANIKMVADRLREEEVKNQDIQNNILGTILSTTLKNSLDPEVALKKQLLEGGGNMGVGGFKPKSINVGGISFERQETPEEQQKAIEAKVAQQTALENVKPYSPEEIRIASKVDLIPKIDDLIKLLEEKDVWEGVRVPFGASRISAFGEEGPWQSFKKGLTAGPGREAGLKLQAIKKLMFSEGGAALTGTEIPKLSGQLNPAYKTEKQEIEDLKDIKKEIQVKARMLRANPAQNPSIDLSQMSDDELRRIANGG